MDEVLIANRQLRPRLQGWVFKSFRFHIVAFSDRSTLVCVFKCLRFHNRLRRFREPEATITPCDLSLRCFCIDATLSCEFKSAKI